MTQPALTKNRAAVLDVLKEAAQPLSAYAILEQVREAGINSPPIVYRALKFLEEQGLIHRIERQNAYIACHGEHPHHAASILLVCESCGKVEEAEEPTLTENLTSTARTHHFTLTHATIELGGHCVSCR